MGDLFSGPHIILIALVLLLLFGGKKIPELMRGLGKGIREFKDAKDNVTKEIEDHLNNTSTSANSTSANINSDQPKISNSSTSNTSPSSSTPASSNPTVIRENRTA
jgi:sec-independent protein translocase protein TatA